MDRREGLALLKASFAIAIIIFFTAVSAEFSVRMYYSSTEPLVQIFSGILGIFVITSIMALLLLAFPNQRRAILRTFGMEEETQK